MSFNNRTVPIVIDVDDVSSESCVRALGDNTGRPASFRTTGWTWVQGDRIKLRIYYWSSSEEANLRLPDTVALVAAGADGGTAVFDSVDWEEVILGTQENPVYAYDLTIGLNDARLAGQLANLASLVADVDIESHTVGGANPQTARLRVKILRQVYTGETLPDPADPPYPPADELVAKLRGSIALPESVATANVTGLDLGAVPAQVLLSLRVPSAEAPLLLCAVAGVPTADGFTVSLSGSTPSIGYVIDYLIIM